MSIRVYADGVLEFRGTLYRCALGRNGIVTNKQEGDGATPSGTYPLLRLFRRADKCPAVETSLPSQDIHPHDGWCDAPLHPDYNRLVKCPFDASHEKMWRDDDLYDLVIEIGHNSSPVVPGAGSAVFMHVAMPDYTPTEGCVALAKKDLLKLLPEWSTATVIKILDRKRL